jgi:PiT family inorganic phosphate transporter
VVFGGLVGAITWNLITWYFGIPSSSSHALIGGYAGAAVARVGVRAIVPGSAWVKTLAFIILSPLLGMIAGFLLMVGVAWTFRKVPSGSVDRWFRRAQLVSAAGYSLSHGANDAQKTMGIIAGLLVANKELFVAQDRFPLDISTPVGDPRLDHPVGACGDRAGTFTGGWRSCAMGSRITKLKRSRFARRPARLSSDGRRSRASPSRRRTPSPAPSSV